MRTLFLLFIIKSTHSVVFDGPCPEVASRGPLEFNNDRGRVVFFTKTESKVNNFFDNYVENFDHLTVTFDTNGSRILITKMNNLERKDCPIEEYLVPDQSGQFFRHEIWLRFQLVNHINQSCAVLWDRYQLQQIGEILVFWGCIDLKSFPKKKHEESLWVMVLARNLTYRLDRAQVERDALAMFPVGRIHGEHLFRTELKPQFRSLDLKVDCRRLLCRKFTESSDIVINSVLATAAALFVVALVVMKWKR